MTREGRQQLSPYDLDADSYKTLFASLFKTCGVIEGLESGEMFDENVRDGLTDGHILGILYNRGQIAYDKTTGMWLEFTEEGRESVYNRGKNVRLFGGGGYNIQRARDDVFVFKANPNACPLRPIVDAKCEMLADFDRAIAQNLDAIKDMSVVWADDVNLVNALKRADKLRRAGRSVAVVRRTTEDYGEMGLLTTKAEYKIDKLLKDRRKLYEELLHLVGVRTPVEKGERMTDDEVHSQNAETDAYIGVMERTFNHTAELYGAPFRLKINVAPVDVVGEEQ